MYGFILENYDLRIMWGYRVVTFKHTVEMPTQKKFGKFWKGLDKALNKVLVENAPLESTFKEAFESLNQE